MYGIAFYVVTVGEDNIAEEACLFVWCDRFHDRFVAAGNNL